MARRLVTYDDLTGLNASTSNTPQPAAPTTTGKQPHWTPDGQPISASAARKYRKTLQLLASGDIAAAETMLLADGMGTAKDSVDMREAIAWAKQKAGTAIGERDRNGQITEKQRNETRSHADAEMVNVAAEDGNDDSYDDSDDDDDDEDDDDVSDNDGYEDEYGGEAAAVEDEEGAVEQSGHHEWQPGTTIDWQGVAGAPSQGRRAKRQKQQQLSHAEIWDDSALVDAWDAAMEEYKLFDAQRTAHLNRQQNKQAGGEHSDPAEQVIQHHSALWYDSPAAGSKEAAAASTATAELEKRKRQAKALLAQYSSVDENGAGAAEVDGAGAAATTTTGDIAWHSARVDAAQAVNLAGGDNENATVPHDAAATGEDDGAGAAAASMTKEEVLQNLAMAWYYAGYYQALAMQMAT